MFVVVGLASLRGCTTPATAGFNCDNASRETRSIAAGVVTFPNGLQLCVAAVHIGWDTVGHGCPTCQALGVQHVIGVNNFVRKAVPHNLSVLLVRLAHAYCSS